MDFSVIAQAPEVRAIVQDGLLERAFHDGLVPRFLYRGEVTPAEFPGQVGDSMNFTGVGLMKKRQRPVPPGQDPTPSSYGKEQWRAQLQQYGDSVDTDMLTSMVAIANLFLRDGHQIGIGAGQSLNGVARDALYNAAESGHTVADTGPQSGTTLRVKRLNGFTRARRPDLTGASPVQFSTVSGSNPLKVTIFDNAVATANTVIGFTADTSGDEVGPGTLTLGTAATSVADRAYVYAYDATSWVLVGGGNKVDDVGSNDLFKLGDVRTAVARFWQVNVPEHEDGTFHVHLDPTSMTQIFADDEFERLLTAMPDHYTYREFGLGQLLGCTFFRNSEAPILMTVGAGDGVFTLDDPFAGEMTNNGNATTGVPLHRVLFTGQECCHEYYSDLSALLTEAGVVGKIAEPQITNNGIEVMTERTRLILRAPLDRFQQKVSTTWQFVGDFPVRTDAATGDAARYKRELIVVHGQ